MKSENVMLREDNTAVIVDFGLARVMEGEVLRVVGSTLSPSTSRKAYKISSPTPTQHGVARSATLAKMDSAHSL